MKLFSEKQGTVSSNKKTDVKLYMKEPEPRKNKRLWCRRRGKMARLRNPDTKYTFRLYELDLALEEKDTAVRYER